MYKVKLANRFNTIEWEAEDLPTVENLNRVYKLLERIEIEGDLNACKITEKKEEPKEEPATEKQIAVLKKLGFQNTENLTKREAWEILSARLTK